MEGRSTTKEMPGYREWERDNDRETEKEEGGTKT